MDKKIIKKSHWSGSIIKSLGLMLVPILAVEWLVNNQYYTLITLLSITLIVMGHYISVEIKGNIENCK